MKNTGKFKIRLMLAFATLLGFILSNHVMASDIYRVDARFYHLGELIAAPQIEVRGDETTSSTYSEPGKSRYKFVVLVRPAGKNGVSVSMQFSSGKINIQPNLHFELGEEASATIDKVHLTVTVQKVATTGQDSRITLGE